LVTEWAEENDPDFAAKLSADKEFATKIFAIGRGGAKPRKDLGLWAEAKAYMGFFYDEYYAVEDEIPENFDKADVAAILRDFAEAYSVELDNDAWFAEVKRIAEAHGFCPDMKEYKKDPTAYKGSVGDVSMFLRIAITGKRTSPDLCSVMSILGEDRSKARLNALADNL
ncbi:MAG: glutamate--tRNA ligase, partial [Clostridia bacterium]|nr:glutamate--tRNA ligase [Clostridia bacterium]